MKIVVKNVGEKPVVKEIERDLVEFKDIVGGYIECVNIGENILCVCNEEGKILGLRANFAVGMDIICGNAFFCSKGYDDFESLNDEQIKMIMDVFN